MINRDFYPIKQKSGMFWKMVNYILLSMGASSVVDITRITVGDNIIVEYFIGENLIIEYSELKLVKSNDSEIIAIEGNSDRLLLEKIADSDNFLKVIKSNSEELGLSLKVI